MRGSQFQSLFSAASSFYKYQRHQFPVALNSPRPLVLDIRLFLNVTRLTFDNLFFFSFFRFSLPSRAYPLGPEISSSPSNLLAFLIPDPKRRNCSTAKTAGARCRPVSIFSSLPIPLFSALASTQFPWSQFGHQSALVSSTVWLTAAWTERHVLPLCWGRLSHHHLWISATRPYLIMGQECLLALRGLQWPQHCPKDALRLESKTRQRICALNKLLGLDSFGGVAAPKAF